MSKRQEKAIDTPSFVPAKRSQAMSALDHVAGNEALVAES
jgi:hypothetical protein